MPRLPFQVHPAPMGMNSAVHPAMLPPSRGRRIQNFRADRAGFLRGSLKLSDVATLSGAADGIAYYYGESVEDDRLLVVANGLLYVGLPIDSDADVWSFSPQGTGFEVGAAVRFASYNDETILVQEGGIQPKRYDGIGLYQLGIDAPASAPIALPGTPSAGTSNKAGTITYYFSYFDRKFRESDLSSGTSINFTTHSGKAGYITVDYGDDPQVYGAYVYATTSGSTTKYRIGTLYKHLSQVTHEDILADSVVNATGATTAPSPGQYAVPNPASCIAVHKRHIILNDVDNPKQLQINNIDSPTQWASVTYLTTDGVRMSIGTHQGAGINALVAFGSLLIVSTRGELLQLWGDEPSIGRRPFELRALHKQGILAPGSFVRCNNEVCGLMDDGQVWMLSGHEGFPLNVISGEIEPELRAHTAAELEAATGAFADNCYLLSIGDTLYIYDFSAGGAWTLMQHD